ncbi:hypothetical protein [Roseovarius indicus]|uniref:Uncharacterized protein n=1 Tax=Roseovarius indicus TaxID=540747 RepID=A0A0T5P933_9RHOB|nr:hypothetical protein [Roseovarius indicus]KRS17505.1 hypothetical protein XM52_13565 [Roseovarius indicus]QEW26705.1 hypothetical protein RIdsm_02507 [Roseovarius indicus]SFD61353.1 hypothetical protein SAMN04488031_101835 [Roseovarius indicus]
MTYPTDEGCGFYTDLPDHSRNGDSAGRGFSSSTPRPGSRARMAFPTLCDAPEPEHYDWIDDGLSRAERWSNRAATALQIAFVVLLFGTLAVHFTEVWDAATVHPDPVEVQ